MLYDTLYVSRPQHVLQRGCSIPQADQRSSQVITVPEGWAVAS